MSVDRGLRCLPFFIGNLLPIDRALFGIIFMSKVKVIKLTAFLHGGVIIGSPGDLVEVTPENAVAVQQLLKERGAKIHVGEAPPVPLRGDGTEIDPDDDEDTDDDGKELIDVEDSDSIDSLAIPPRYKAALRDAGLLTVGQLKAAPDLAAVPGMNKKAAANVLALIQ